jgi:hypothetical protein
MISDHAGATTARTFFLRVRSVNFSQGVRLKGVSLEVIIVAPVELIKILIFRNGV